jgi:MFS family permease
MSGAMWGIGTVLGPVVGGAFTDSSAGWRWAFYVNLPIGAAMAPILVFLIPSVDLQKGTPFLYRLLQIDWPGVVLLVGTVVSFILGLSFGGNQFAWNSAQVIGSFAAAGVLLLLFVFSQTLYMPGQSRERRIFPVEMLFNRTTLLLYILTATASTLAFVTIYYIPLFFQFTKVKTQ